MVPEEVRRARQLRCSQCGRAGAAMGCDVADCECTYHLPCAMLQVGREGLVQDVCWRCRWGCCGLCTSYPTAQLAAWDSSTVVRRWVLR